MGPRALLSAAIGYVKNNPDEVVRAAVNAATLRFGVPLAALRYLAQQATGRKAPKDIDIDSSPPALRLAATVDAMGTPIRASAAIRIDEVSLSSESIRIGIRLNEVKLALVGESDAPIATLIKSGALDLSKPGNLIRHIPKRPPAIVEAGGDRVVLDLCQLLGVITPVLGIRAIETEDDHIYVAFRASPGGIGRALEAFRGG
jgi:hypothetical protein